MSKEPATPPQAGDEPPINAGLSRPGARRSRHAGVQSERQAVQGALHDGAGTSSAMATQGGHERHVSLVLPPQEGGQVVHPGQRQERPYRGEERQPPGHGGAGGFTQQPAQAGRPRPSYVPPSQKWREQPYAAPPSWPPAEEERPTYPLRGFQLEERLATPLPQGGAPPVGGSLPMPGEDAPPRRKPFRIKKKETKTTTILTPDAPVAHDVRPRPHQQQTPGEAEPPGVDGLATAGGAPPPGVGTLAAPAGADGLAAPGGGAPPYGGSATAPGRAPWRGRFGVPSTKSIQRVSTLVDFTPATGGSPSQPGEAATPAPPGGGSLATPAGVAGAGGLAAPGGAAPPYGGRAPSRGRFGVPNTKSIQRVSTLVDFTPATGGTPSPPQEHGANPHPRPQTEKYPPQPQEHDAYPHRPSRQHKYPPGPPPPREHDVSPHPRQETGEYPRATPTGPSPGRKLLPQRKKKRRPAAICFTLCCILFWLLVVALGVAVLLMYLVYHPQPPRLRVTTATLNAGYVDQLPPPHTGLALNSDLSVLATIYNPNTKIDVVLRYMQLDLYFGGVMIGTQAVWPPILARPGETELRDVHLVVSEVRLSPENAEAWRNATAKGGLVEVKLAARFHVQLDFGRWFPFRYWVRPSCALWLDPPPGGALRRARCHKSTI